MAARVRNDRFRVGLRVLPQRPSDGCADEELGCTTRAGVKQPVGVGRRLETKLTNDRHAREPIILRVDPTIHDRPELGVRADQISHAASTNSTSSVSSGAYGPSTSRWMTRRAGLGRPKNSKWCFMDFAIGAARSGSAAASNAEAIP